MDAERTGPERARHGPRRGTAGRKPGRQGRGMRAQRRSPEGAPPTATLASVDPDYGTALPGDMKTRLARLDRRGIERTPWNWDYGQTTYQRRPPVCFPLVRRDAGGRPLRVPDR